MFAARWNGTTWDQFTRVTDDAVRDIGVQAGYRSNGTPELIWARATEIVGIHGPLTGPVQSFLSLSDTASAEFHSARLVRLPDGMVLTWARAGSVFYSLSNSDASEWTPARMLPYTDAFERSVSSFMAADGRVHVGFLRSTAASDSTLNTGSSMVVRSVDTVSTTTGANIDPTTIEVPNSFVLHDPYPNPFNPTTTIRYELPTESDVRIFVFDVLGRKVADLMEKRQSAGTQSARWDASHVPSGLYICRFEAVGSDGSVFAGSKKIILIK